MKTFRPFSGYVEVKPIEKKSIISQDNNFVEAGEIVTIGENPCYFGIRNGEKTCLKIGDVLFFEAYGCYKTTKEVDGMEHYLVPLDEKIIKGVYGE